MQMDKRNQIGCEDTTKLSKEGVVFDIRRLPVPEVATSSEGGTAPATVAGVGLEGLCAPALKVQ